MVANFRHFDARGRSCRSHPRRLWKPPRAAPAITGGGDDCTVCDERADDPPCKGIMMPDVGIDRFNIEYDEGADDARCITRDHGQVPRASHGPSPAIVSDKHDGRGGDDRSDHCRAEEHQRQHHEDFERTDNWHIPPHDFTLLQGVPYRERRPPEGRNAAPPLQLDGRVIPFALGQPGSPVPLSQVSARAVSRASFFIGGRDAGGSCPRTPERSPMRRSPMTGRSLTKRSQAPTVQRRLAGVRYRLGHSLAGTPNAVGGPVGNSACSQDGSDCGKRIRPRQRRPPGRPCHPAIYGSA